MIKLAAIGVGNRTGKYLKYLEEYPGRAQLVAIVEPDPVRRENARKRFSLPAESCYERAEDFFSESGRCDAVIIGSPDSEHYPQAMQAISRGYHVLLEKPVAQNYGQCEAIVRASEKAHVKVGVCYVLRFMPVYRKIKELLDSGAIGRVTDVSHQEYVGIDRMLHTYVRGYWNKASESNPSFLSKCCHDVDMLLWTTGARIKSVQSTGSLEWYRPENAPAGSTDYCIDCPVEKSCAYSAIDMYIRRGVWTDNFPVPERVPKEEVILEQMRLGRFGRCAFKCGNDVADRQVVTMLSTEGMLITVLMNTFTRRDGRSTVFSGTEGEIIADGWVVELRSHKDGKVVTFDYSSEANNPLHDGADLEIVDDFVRAVEDPSRQPAIPIRDALESHRVCFMAG